MEKFFVSTEVEMYPSKAQFSGLKMDILALPLGIGIGWFSTNLYCTKLDVKKAKDSTIPPVTIFCSGFFKRFFFAVWGKKLEKSQNYLHCIFPQQYLDANYRNMDKPKDQTLLLTLLPILNLSKPFDPAIFALYFQTNLNSCTTLEITI